MCKDTWTTTLNEILTVKFITKEEASDYNKHALGICADFSNVPIKFSLLLHFVVEADKQNPLIGGVVGKQKHECGLVVPAKFFAVSKKLMIG